LSSYGWAYGFVAYGFVAVAYGFVAVAYGFVAVAYGFTTGTWALGCDALNAATWAAVAGS
jgi:hypothetical protein